VAAIKETEHGTLYAKDTLFFRMAQAEAHDPATDITYECTTNVAGGTPIVTSGKTGKSFVVSWANIIALARAAGIDEE
jgi:anti-sigma factor ChrR (cupin superfamily)